MGKYKILSLDGGGSWALIQVRTLINLYSKSGTGDDIKGHEILNKFDLAIGNSGGTITLGGLLMDKPLSEILGYFQNQKLRNQIFVRASIFRDPFSRLTGLAGIGYKYDTDEKLVGLKAILGPLSEVPVSTVPASLGMNYRGKPTNVVFCAFDYDNNRETFFRSDTKSITSASHLDTSIVLAIHASTNAPLNYFDAPAEAASHRYWDGAVGGYNNPVFAGAVEALANAKQYETSREEICALSLGTANVALPPQKNLPQEDPALVAHRQDWTLPNDIQKMATCILDDPPDAASFHAHVALDGPLPADGNLPVTTGRIVRMNPLVQPVPGTGGVPWALPQGMSRDDFKALVNLDMDAVAQPDVQRISTLCDLWLADHVLNQPIQTDPVSLQPRIGHRLFSQAKAAWNALQ